MHLLSAVLKNELVLEGAETKRGKKRLEPEFLEDLRVTPDQ